MIYVRRTTEHGEVHLLGRTFAVDPLWGFRLVRCEVDFTAQRIRCYALRRRQPDQQPLLAELPYALPRRPSRSDRDVLTLATPPPVQ